ncbi:MAG: nuclear transport factor 2 family protein [Chloracidobacterium sp.]|nr:nuclear transport factor 2 family protein [Chloracidobacterium sp.]MBK8303805.1 nuclear transport factor 2 family protein [Chloracidobacterium sp.]
MKRTAFISLFILTMVVAGFGQKAGAAKVDASKGVRDAFDRLIDGIKQVDAEKVMAAYEKSDRLLIFNNNGTATIGWETVKTNVENTYAKVSNVTMDITGLRVEMMGKTNAYVSCKWRQSQEFDGKLEDSSGRMTLIYKLVGKDWKITHRHTSPDKPDATRPVFPSERQN